jgi:hypothetical protein
MRAALSRLKKERIIRSVPGKGNFIVPAGERTKLTLLLHYGEDPMQSPFSFMAINTILSVFREKDIPGMMGVMHEADKDWSHLGVDSSEVKSVLALGGNRKYWHDLSKRTQVPVVVLNDFTESIRQPVLCTQIINDECAAAFLATKTLLNRGHRNIVIMLWSKGDVWVRDMERGYRAAFEDAGLECDENLILEVLYTEGVELFEMNVKNLFKEGRDPTALIYNGSVENHLSELLQTCFYGKLESNAVITLGFEELLTNSFQAKGEAWAVAMSFRSMVNHAIKLLDEDGNDIKPTRLIIDENSLYKRIDSKWKAVTK